MRRADWPDAAPCGAEVSVTDASASPFEGEREGVSILLDEFVKKAVEKQKALSLSNWAMRVPTFRGARVASLAPSI